MEMCYSDSKFCPSLETCTVYKPPPLPPVHSRYYDPLWNFVFSNATLRTSYQDYSDICRDFVDIGPTTPVISESTKGETANAGLIIGLLILSLFLLALLVFALVWRWKKKKKEEQSSQALPIDEYRNVNYLHNKVSLKTAKPWNGSSVQESKVENEYTDNHKDNTLVTGNGNLKTGATNGTEIGKGAQSENTMHGYVNNMFDNREQNGQGSPGILSNKSDTPLLDNIDGHIIQTLPNETVLPKIGKKTEAEDADKLKMYGSTKTVSQNRGSALEPIKSPEKPSPRKKKNKSLRKSAPCPNVNDLVEDMAENRKSV